MHRQDVPEVSTITASNHNPEKRAVHSLFVVCPKSGIRLNVRADNEWTMQVGVNRPSAVPRDPRRKDLAFSATRGQSSGPLSRAEPNFLSLTRLKKGSSRGDNG